MTRSSIRLMDAPQSVLIPVVMPAAFTIFRHLAISVLMTAANSAELLPTGSMPTLSRLGRVSGASAALIASAVSRDRMACGVFAGASRPTHDECSYPGTPASAIVGYSGAVTDRFALEIAIARTLPE